MFSYVLVSLFIDWSKKFYDQSEHYNILKNVTLNVTFYHFHFQKRIQKSLFTPWKLESNKWFKYWFCAYVFGSDWYLFQLIVLLKPGFNCRRNFALYGIHKVLKRFHNDGAPKQFKKVPQWWLQNSLKRFHNDSIKLF